MSKSKGGHTNSDIYVGRNIRTIQKESGVPRAAKGVGVAILRFDVQPDIAKYAQQCLFECQSRGRRTVKDVHADQAFKDMAKCFPGSKKPEIAIRTTNRAAITAS